MKFVLLISSLCLFVANFSLAHGEDKYGPHKGFVRMPGAFHTEILPASKNIIKIFLLDIQWKNPSIAKSSIALTYVGATEVQSECKAESNYFICEFPKTVNLYKKGELKLTAVREDQKGNQAIYKLPLKLEKSVPTSANQPEMKMDHSGHH